MSKELINNNPDLEVSGFYYDYQKKNPMMRVTLHANTKPPAGVYDSWKAWSHTNSKDLSQDFPYWKDSALDPDEDSSAPKSATACELDPRYGQRSLCSSIISEDFNVSIANSWGEHSGGQQLQDMFNSGFKMFEPYAREGGTILSKLSKGLTAYKTSNPDSLIPESFIDKAIDISGKASKASREAGNVFGRNLIVQGTRFKYYAGTGLSFSNLGMKFTLFADYIEQTKEDGSPISGTTGNQCFKFMTPDDQLAPLLPYAVGKYVPLISEKDGDVDKWISSLGLTDIAKDNKDILNKFLGWQLPPGGFQADISYIDHVQPGTLMLKIGPYYRLKNLVIQDIQLNYSKNTAKYYDVVDDKIKTCPLYCDVFITLTPANKYSDEMLKKFVATRSNINGNETICNSIMNLEERINNNLK